MSDKQALAGYLVNLLAIMESKETAGLPRGTTLADEYNKVYGELVETIRNEREQQERK